MKINEISPTTAKGPYGLKQVTNPLKHEDIERKAELIAAQILKQGSIWFEATKGVRVYRGVHFNDEVPVAFVRKTRLDRKPRDTGSFRHKAFNALIAAGGGIANRSNSIFLTSDHTMAGFYGNIFVVIPLGAYNYTWSPVAKDWTNKLKYDKLISFLNPAIVKTIYKKPLGPFELSAMLEKLTLQAKNYDPKKVPKVIQADTGLSVALKKGTEIMVKCEKTLFINAYFYKDYVQPLLTGKAK